jgi:hypothetical protein
MRQLCHFNLFACALVSFLTIAFSSSPALAVVTVVPDGGRASNVEGIGTANVVIYGGIAGTSCGGDADKTCSSCLANTAGGNGGLQFCNDRRINSALVLTMTVNSNQVDHAFPNIAFVSSSGAATNTIETQTGTASGSVAKGSPGTISMLWSALCPLLTPLSGTGSLNSSCQVVGVGTYFVGTFYVGLKAVNDTSPFVSGTDDYATIKIAVSTGDSTNPTIASASGTGISYFEMISGDNKGTIGSLNCGTGSSFPNGTNIPFRWVRVLFEKRTDPATDVFSKINEGSPHTDLQISATGTCSATSDSLTLSPIEITDGTIHNADHTTTGVSISNDSVYDMKVAVVDAAGNAEFYSDGANDKVCNNVSSQNPLSHVPECHTIRPAVVVGVLANQVNCFIATASYGSPMAGEVDTFRHFRDTYLIPTKLGLKFVRWYYNEGPAYAHFIRQKESYRAIARGFLWLPLQFAKISMAYGLFAGVMFLIFALLMPVAVVAGGLRLRRRRSVRHHA